MQKGPEAKDAAKPIAGDPLADEGYLAALIAQVTDRPIDEVWRRWRRELEHLGANVGDAMREAKVEPYTWSDRLVEFYQTTDAFLYESIVWSRTDIKEAMRDWIVALLARREAAPLRILVYGDGPGFDSLRLAQAGHKVTYFEVGQNGNRFARQLFADAKADVEIARADLPLADEAYDAVVCLDVLEHVPDPEVMVSSLSRAIRPGGYLIVHAPFWLIHPSCGTHLRSNLRLSGEWRRLYGVQGLVPVDAQLFWNPLALQKVGGGHAPPAPSWAAWGRIRLGGWLLRRARITPAIHMAAYFTLFRPRSRFPARSAKD